ncbi:amidohydrolase family protein [Streptacidiphilus sp. P02-A3a]|uniref:amidohydrolase family protein n=1 Tax=Streptacidiphilus sp. P02-A3a TaxID=2704468 RepID=UPI0015F7A0E2|nr:amidohydrolase family protein [Streptacidiphilus sp. P02-A3a]QMU67342.1 amidohydrolase family protein [Streptacidiphilus sp. P02-A3a]
MESFLLRNGLVIDTEPEPSAHPGWDVLIEDGRIAAVGPNLRIPAGTTVLDASDRIVLPGFVDTHRHVWQAVLRSIAVDVDLPDYFQLVRQQLGPRFRPEDVRAANLLGSLECLDAGVTTVQDFAYARADRVQSDGFVPGFDLDYAEAALDGTRAAGVRAVFGYLLTPQHQDDVRRARELVGGESLITMAAASLGPSNQKLDAIEADWRLADELGLPIVTHVASGPVNDRPIEVLREHGLLRPNTLYVHGNSLADDELAMIADSGSAVSITPAVEARLGHGGPLIGRLRAAGVTTGLGVDVVTTVGGDMFSVIRAGLLTSYLVPGPHLTPADLLRMATLDGARALGLGDRVGSLKVGKQADIVLLRAGDLNLAGTHDPIGSVVSAAHPGNVDTVLVAGRIVKQGGRLLHHDLSTVRQQAREASEFVTSAAAASA